jgi:hypothetical protein
LDDFEQKGVVSVWAFLEREDRADADKDVLIEFCGLEDYDSDSVEGATSESLQPLASLLGPLSYSSSFINEALNEAGRLGIKEAYGVMVHFDLGYDPSNVTRAISVDPVFIGKFVWLE